MGWLMGNGLALPGLFAESSSQKTLMNQQIQMKEPDFTEGQEIEIPGHFTNLYSWYTAKVIETLVTADHRKKLVIEYERLKAPKTSTPLREIITDLAKVRPKPPQITQKVFNLNQIVDAFFANGWWKGEIVGVSSEGLSYMVLLDSPTLRFRQIPVRFGDMRLHQDWVAEKWVAVTPIGRIKHHQGGVRITDEPQLSQAGSSDSKSNRRKRKIKQSSQSTRKKRKIKRSSAISNDTFSSPAKKSDNRETTEGSCTQIAQEERRMTTRSTSKLSNLTSLSDVEEAPQREAKECWSPSFLVVETEEYNSSEVDQYHINETEQEELSEIQMQCSQDKLEIQSSPQCVGDKEMNGRNEALNKPRSAVWDRADPYLAKCSMTLSEHAVTRGQSYKASENGHMIFTKSFTWWKYVESLEVFRRLPQDPHFRSLNSTNEMLCEGEAIGYMLSFASIVDKTQRAQPNEPKSNLEKILEALTLLEDNGFDVERVQQRIKELIRIKEMQVPVGRMLKECEEEIAKERFEKEKTEAEIGEVDEKILEIRGLFIRMKEKRESLEREKKIKGSSIAALETKVHAIKEKIKTTKHEFGLAAAAPW